MLQKIDGGNADLPELRKVQQDLETKTTAEVKATEAIPHFQSDARCCRRIH